MACGCPVVVGGGTACAEIAGDAAILVDPADAVSMGHAITGILKNRDLAGRHSEAGLIRSERFSWRRTAAQTIDAYQRLAEHKSRSVKNTNVAEE
jgi:glycosyltransferase involved in cell wall biosynthesis